MTTPQPPTDPGPVPDEPLDEGQEVDELDVTLPAPPPVPAQDDPNDDGGDDA